ncbi:hypothetical protein CesoFtcFv8_009587 [Champsocephalus esox]|uniref:Uncharacterized protein n=1 Tax=Champsocephalus esox TaxID=159716 RepID=A0AAN8H2R4_9TELE|nr:hypothetical protein CesoFtcFv8_009587 [Champsocephalus esox]
MQGPICYTLIRTALSDYARKTQDAASRKKVTDFMCHDTSTADRFYATMPDAKEAAVIRTIMAKALECPPSQSRGGVGSSEEETTSEEEDDDDTVVLYQDSSSSSQDEEFRAELKRRKENRREEVEAEREKGVEAAGVSQVSPCSVVLTPLKRRLFSFKIQEGEEKRRRDEEGEEKEEEKGDESGRRRSPRMTRSRAGKRKCRVVLFLG